MKTYIKRALIIPFFFIISLAFGQTPRVNDHTTHFQHILKLSDDWYVGFVKHFNTSSSTWIHDTLSVEVKDNRVIKIDFRSGRPLYAADNNDSYTYTGGYLDFKTNDRNDIIEAETEVTITVAEKKTVYGVLIK
jgi:hypothetical protein